MSNHINNNEFIIKPENYSILKHNDMSYNNITVSKRIFREGLKRNNLTNVIFENAQLIRCAFAGSLLKNVKFLNTVMRGNAWTFCVFNKCTFNNERQITNISSNFSNSSFFNCIFKNVIISASSFIKSQFINCRFENCTLASSTFEDAIFNNCKFKNCDIGSTNLEFCEFRACYFCETILPLYQVCYVIGGIEHVLDIKNSIKLRSGKKLYACDSLYSFYDRMNEFYIKTKQPFALANTAVINKDYEAVKKHIFDGIDFYLVNKNFRMIKHLCRLGKLKGVLDIHQGKQILDLIDNFLVTQKSEAVELSFYVMHAADLRTLLYDYYGTESMLTIEIQTNITPNEHEKVNSLINNLSSVFDEYEDVNHNIQIRHNSPFLLFCTVVGMVGSLVAISEALIKLGYFIYKKVKGKNTETQAPPTSNASMTINVSGDLVISNSQINGITSNCEVNSQINSVSNKLITQNGVAITKIERHDNY